MPSVNRACLVGLAAFAWYTGSGLALAKDDTLAQATPSPPRAVPSESALARPSPLGGKPVGLAVLAAGRGGTQVLNDMRLKGIVANNQASQLTTGANMISEGAFSGAAGLPMVIQNSGNNVLIQNATIVNLQIGP